jgi:hypothetical protein
VVKSRASCSVSFARAGRWPNTSGKPQAPRLPMCGAPPIRKRMRAKLRQVNQQLRERMHDRPKRGSDYFRKLASRCETRVRGSGRPRKGLCLTLVSAR